MEYSVQFSRSVVSDSLRPHESQHARPPCLSPTPGVHSDSHPSSQWCHLAISSSVVPFSSYPQSLPASDPFPISDKMRFTNLPKTTGLKWLSLKLAQKFFALQSGLIVFILMFSQLLKYLPRKTIQGPLLQAWTRKGSGLWQSSVAPMPENREFSPLCCVSLHWGHFNAIACLFFHVPWWIIYRASY